MRKMKVLQILSLIVLIGGFSLSVRAQACYMSIAEIYLKSASDEKPIAGANVEIFELIGNKRQEFDLAHKLFDKDTYSIHLGLERRGTFIFRISAEGFETTEQQVYFFRGMTQWFELNLKRQGTNEKTSFQKLIHVSGRVLDNYKALVPAAGLTAVAAEGRIYKTKSDEAGRYSLKLPSGEYTLQFEKTGFKVLKIVNLQLNSQNYELIDANLEVRACDDCDGDMFKEKDDTYRNLVVLDYKKLKSKEGNNKQ